MWGEYKIRTKKFFLVAFFLFIEKSRKCNTSFQKIFSLMYFHIIVLFWVEHVDGDCLGLMHIGFPVGKNAVFHDFRF